MMVSLSKHNHNKKRGVMLSPVEARAQASLICQVE